MRAATIPVAQVMAAGRMDAAFHVMSKKHENVVRQLREKHDDDAAQTRAERILAALTRERALCLKDLTTHNGNGNPSMGDLEKTIERYPHLTLAVLLSQKDDILSEQKRRITEEQANLETLEKQFD